MAVRIRETLTLLGLFFLPSRNRARTVYDLLGTHNSLAEQSHFINLGYWAEADSYDEAGAALAMELGTAAALTDDDEVLDVGCGFGDQDALWMESFGPKRLVALNITPSHVAEATRRFDDPRLTFQVGSATEMPFDDDSFDVIVGLESAFHFDTRADFIREAGRVVRSGGRIALADVVPTHAPSGPLGWAKAWFGGGLWQVPLANQHGLDVYQERLEAAGFTAVKVRDISEHVWGPFKAYAIKRVQDPEIRDRVHPMLRWIWGTPHSGTDDLQYVIITARRA